MNIRSISALLLLATTTLAAQEQRPLWLKSAAISPDGKSIAFTYKGDIFTVAVAGGKATQITSNEAYDSEPVWSPDGSRIAFRSNREGSDDIFIVGSYGGTPRRVTTDSGHETPLAFMDNTTLLYSTSAEKASAQSAMGPFGFPVIYKVDVAEEGARPVLYNSTPMRSISYSPAGILYADKKGYEDPLRKHERSSGTADIWLLTPEGNYTRLTDFNGHDLYPVWTDPGRRFAYVSEEDGTLNIWSRSVDGKDKKQLTHFTKHPVRGLSVAGNGTLAFSWDGELYTLAPGASEPKRVDVAIYADDYDSDLVKNVRSSGAEGVAVSPDGSQIALVIRGDIYVTSTKYKTTRRITDTPAQERVANFSPDGKRLVYDSDRNGYWQLFIAQPKDTSEQFVYATEIVEEPLYKCATAAQQPSFSPDGKKVAFLENRTELRVIDLDTKQVTTALDGKYNYSYSDGDISFDWSPDSKWLLIDYIGVGGWNNPDVALVKADGTKVVDLTESGFSDAMPRWALKGGAVTYVTSKYGMKNPGSWGNTYDVVLLGLNGETWDDYMMNEEEKALKEKAEKAKEKEKSDASKDKKKEKKKDKKKAEASQATKDLEFELDDIRYRRSRLTANSSFLSDYYLDPKGDKFYYIANSTEGEANLYQRDLRKDGETKVLAKGVSGGILADKKGETIFVFSWKSLKKITLSDGKTENIEYSAEYDRKPSLEREYIYDHMLRQVRDKFYDENLHGVDWDYYGEHYRKFLPYINNNRDFAQLLSEILGELNASHTGGRASAGRAATPVARLGAFYDTEYAGDGLKISEILPRGPLSPKKVGAEKGDIIVAIDGHKILAGKDYNSFLENKSGRNTLITLRKADGKEVTRTVKPISAGSEQDLLYQRWVERNEAVVDSLSGGRVGYIHVEGMNTASFRNAYDRILGKYRNCDAVIVDTRYNGGGWLHNDLALLLSGREYVKFAPRGRFIGNEPFSQWTKPSVMLVNESNYSDAHGAPYTYQTLGLGDVVGAPIPGTMTAVWWETQIDPGIIFGIPQVTSVDMKGEALENKQLNPDIEVYNSPAEVERGVDRQIETAVRHLLEKTSQQSSEAK